LPKLSTCLAIAVIAVGAGACASSTGSTGSTTGSRTTRSPDVISRADIEATTTGNAYDLVNRLRPQWLRATGVGSVSGGNPSTYGIVVFLDNVRLGGVETLRNVDSGSIASIRYLTPERAATTLPGLGREPISGAIVVSTR
jgi:hypothetical protein